MRPNIPLAIVQFDAHRDVEEGEAGRLDHGAMFTYAVNEGLVDPKRSVQVGIRTCFNGEKSHGMTILTPTRCIACRRRRSQA